MSPNTPKCTLYAVFADASPRAVIYRRGPSAQTCVIAWDRSDDTFEVGQWFKGTVKPSWGGLSPNGAWLVSHLGKHRGLGTWTVLSRPPYLTAVALWPKGDLWGGGGIFVSDRRLVLTHGEGPYDLAPGFPPPPGIEVVHATRDMAPLIETMLPKSEWQRNTRPEGGWIRRSRQGHGLLVNHLSYVAYRADPRLSLAEMARFALLVDGKQSVPLPVSGWAAFDHNGDVLFSRGGALFRLHSGRSGSITSEEELLSRAEQLADFSDLRFRPLAAPYTSPTVSEDGSYAPRLDRVSREDRRMLKTLRKLRQVWEPRS